MQITQPAPDCQEFADLPMHAREDVRRWTWTFQNNPVTKPITDWFNRVAQVLEVKPSTVKHKYYALKKTGSWKCLVDHRKGSKHSDLCRTNDEGFQLFFKTLCEKNQRSTEAAIRELKRMWRAKMEIPGYMDLPNWPKMPSGWGNRNLRRFAPNKAELDSMRFGVKTAAKHLPQIFSTRVGLWAGAFYQFDDVWHDNYVRVMNTDGKSIVTRVLELGCLDVLSGCRFAFGAKPRMPKADGSGMENLKEKEMRLFLANVLYNYGYNPVHGTTLVIENGTATVREDVELMLKEATGGKVTISRSGLQGKQQAILNLWGGRNGGNPRHKASLESLHNLIHNELANVIGQTGHDRNEPEATHGLVEYQRKILKALPKLDPKKAELLKHPVLDFHSQFYPLLNEVYEHAINGRTDHTLEGWEKCGFTINEYTVMPGSEQWLTLDRLPEATQPMILAAAKQDPDTWSQCRKLSPMEVWLEGKPQLQKISPYVVCDILGKDFAKKRVLKGAYIKFSDSDICPEELIYSSKYRTKDGRSAELVQGESYMVFCNPYAPEQLFVCDMHFVCLGICKRIERVSGANEEQVLEAYGKASQRKANLLEGVRMRHSLEEKEAVDLREHNRRIIAGELVNPTERRSEGGKKAGKTRRTNRVNKVAEEAYDDEVLDSWSQPTPTPESTPHNSPLEEDGEDCPFA